MVSITPTHYTYVNIGEFCQNYMLKATCLKRVFSENVFIGQKVNIRKYLWHSTTTGNTLAAIWDWQLGLFFVAMCILQATIIGKT